jgi:hypothetical protein
MAVPMLSRETMMLFLPYSKKAFYSHRFSPFGGWLCFVFLLTPSLESIVAGEPAEPQEETPPNVIVQRMFARGE